MRFSLFVLLEGVPRKSHRQVYDEVIEQAILADQLGYHAFWLAEHHFTDYGICPSPAVLSAAIAARTKRIRIGAAISVLPFHDPRLVAEEYAMVDVISGGRLDFGVGRGYSPSEFHALDIPMTESQARFDESLTILEGLWNSDVFSYDGRYFRVPEISIRPQPVQSPVPIWVAAVRPESFERAARAGRQFMSAPQITPIDKSRENYDLYRRVYVQSGHDPAKVVLPMQRPVFVAATAEQAYHEPRNAYMFYIARNAAQMAGAGAGGKTYDFYEKAQRHLASVEYDDLYKKGLLLFAEPTQLTDQIRHLQKELGLTDLICWMNIGGIEHELVVQSMKLFAEKVMPLF